MYKITATLSKAGNTQVDWIRFSEKEMTMRECEVMLSGKTEAGKSIEEWVTITDFRCQKVSGRK